MSTIGVDNAFTAVDPYLDGIVRQQTLNAALRLGLVDLLIPDGAAVPESEVARRLELDEREFEMLAGMLRQLGVLNQSTAALQLTQPFRHALKYRDLLEVKLDYALLLSRTMGDLYPKVVREPRRFLGELIEIFEYDSSDEFSADSRALTERWVRYMSTLTRHEAPWLLSRWDVQDGAQILEIGGNIGEMAVQTCRALPNARVTVADLPVVCAIGRDHVRQAGLADRIQFAPGDVYKRPPPPGPYDLLLTKSFLHDWDMKHVRKALARGTELLAPGGRVVVFEKLPYDFTTHKMSDPYVIDLPFMSHLREPIEYVRVLKELGFGRVTLETVSELNFMLLTAHRDPEEV